MRLIPLAPLLLVGQAPNSAQYSLTSHTIPSVGRVDVVRPNQVGSGSYGVVFKGQLHRFGADTDGSTNPNTETAENVDVVAKLVIEEEGKEKEDKCRHYLGIERKINEKIELSLAKAGGRR